VVEKMSMFKSVSLLRFFSRKSLLSQNSSNQTVRRFSSEHYDPDHDPRGYIGFPEKKQWDLGLVSLTAVFFAFICLNSSDKRLEAFTSTDKSTEDLQNKGILENEE